VNKQNFAIFAVFLLIVYFVNNEEANALGEPDNTENKYDINSQSEIMDGLKLTIFTDKKYYFREDPINIKWTAENIGSEDITYQLTSSTPGCDDGFRLKVIGDSKEYESFWFKPAGVLLISPDDTRLKKFDDDVFYGKILSMIELGEPRSYGIIMIVADQNKDKVENLLKTKHNATGIGVGQRLSFVTAQVPVQEIPKLADYDIIARIGDGEERACNEAMGIGTLSVGKSSEGSFSWSQQMFPRFNDKQEIIPSGHYTVQLSFAGGKTSVSIFIDDEIPSPKKQLAKGISLNEITCKDNLELIFKSTDGSPACVKPKTAEKLIERGWTSK
jgi:hypothetical protein